MMHSIRRRMTVFGLAAILAAELTFATPSQARAFNDEYVFATTRSVNNMDANPALKLTLFPVSIVLDTALLPFAVIAGFVT